MQKSKDALLEKMNSHLFADKETTDVVFSADQQSILLRYKACFTKWISEPYLRDTQMIAFTKNTFGVSQAVAFKDIANVKALLGNVTASNKEFQRHRATDMILKGYDLASNADSHMEVKQAMAMIRAGEALVRVQKLDKEDIDNIPWDKIIPIDLQPSSDISVIGRKPIKDLEDLKRKLREKYNTQTIDVSYTTVEDDQ